MRSLLIGADGQVGHELLGRLPRMGEVMATTRTGRLADGRACDALDLQDPDALRATVSGAGAQIVWNAAAYTAVDRAESDREVAFAVNATAPGVLAEECTRLGIPLVHFSTDYVFPGTGLRPLCEDDPVGPASVYGASKLAGEEAIRTAGNPHKIFRLCWVYGSRGTNFLLTMMRLAAGKDELRVVSDQFGCPTPAAWIAEAVIGAVRQQPRLSGTWHLAASGQTSWHGFAEAIVSDAFEGGLLARRPVVTPISTADYPTSAQRPRMSVLDCSKLEREFGIRLPDWRSGVAAVVSALRRS
jgi:dTDP-4-dehydrorhamnose reductase